MSPTDKARSKLLAARRLVIKIGSRALVNKRGNLDRKVFSSVAADVAYLRERGRQVSIVSSGSILVGRNKMGLSRNLTMPQKQAAAAVGQQGLMAEWGKALGKHGLVSGQILVTTEDLGHRMRYLNSRNTLEELLKMGVVPVINENDTVAVEEIRYGDNDRIATLVVAIMNADGLVLLTDIDGLCARDPAKYKDAEIVHTVREKDLDLFACAGPSHSGVGSGGMASKIDAARTAANLGVPTVIANAKTENVITRTMEGEAHGTLFVPEGPRMKDKHFFLAFAGEYRGTIKIDNGARRAVVERGKSLLPSGALEISGRFGKGDVVRVVDESGTEVARGLTQYNSGDLRKIMGKKSSEIETVLGQKLYDEIIHRDHLALTGSTEKNKT